MNDQRKPFNPFYALLVVAGVMFTLTACAYGVLMVRGIRPAISGTPESGLMVLMDRHGFAMLMVELAVLAIATVGAIGTDDFWSRRATRTPTTEPQDHD